jgi:hypothetical protein
LTPGAWSIRSIVRRPFASTPVWFVTSPTACPRSSWKPCAASVSIPVPTGTTPLAQHPGGPPVDSPPGVSDAVPTTGAGGAAGAKSAAPTAAATRTRSSRIRAALPPFG